MRAEGIESMRGRWALSSALVLVHGMTQAALRSEIIATCRAMNAAGINQGTSGNVSARSGERFLLTPSGVDYASMQPDDIVNMRFDGSYDGKRLPSSEWRIHRDVLDGRPEINVVIHAHPISCTTLAIHQQPIPAIHYLIGLAGGSEIRCAPYATPTTQALSDVALDALAERRACLLAHHGAIVLGDTPSSTLALLVEVENLAEQYWRALQLGEPPVLSETDMSAALDVLDGYGRQPDPDLRKA